jgi:hypothetical protein
VAEGRTLNVRMCNVVPFRLVAIMAVLVAVVFVNLHGTPDAKPGTLSHRKWVHGWPATWLSRTWVPYYVENEIALYAPAWPWVELPGEDRVFFAPGVLVDIVVGVAVTVGMIAGLIPTWKGISRNLCVASLLSPFALLAVVWLLAAMIPQSLGPLSYLCVYGGAAFTLYKLLPLSRSERP